MKMYRLKYLFTFLALLTISASVYSSNDDDKLGGVTVEIAPILSFEVNNLDIDFEYDEFTGENTDVFDKNWFRVTGNAHWEFSIFAASEYLTCSESSQKVSVGNIQVQRNDDYSVNIDLSTTPQVLLTGVGTIPTSEIRLRWWFKDMDNLGNIRAGSYTVGVIYQLTSSDFPVGSGPL